MSLGYAALADMGIDVSLHEAQEQLRAGGYPAGEVIVHPLKTCPCTTTQHKGEQMKHRAPAIFRLSSDNGHADRYLCRYCLFILAHARQQRNSGLWMQLVESARTSIEREAD